MRPDINYLSKPEGVSMGDAWFSVASPKHFWIRRRFQVLQKLAGDFRWRTSRLGEIGCGSGLVQRQIEDHFGTTLDGFDLNEYALKESVCQTSQRYCYNIHARNEAFKAIYDGMILFDVIEHLDDHKGFLESALFHVKPGGRVFVIDFKRIEGESSDWTMKHVRAGQEVFEEEILACGYKKVREHSKMLKENYFVEFERVAK